MVKVVDISPRSPGFVPGSVRMKCVVDKVALGQAFLRVLQISPSISFYRGSSYSCIVWGMQNSRSVGIFSSLFYDAFSLSGLCSVDNTVTTKWWWIDEHNLPCLKRVSNPRSQRLSDKGLRLRPRSRWDRPASWWLQFRDIVSLYRHEQQMQR
jgi:hypothetical protein